MRSFIISSLLVLTLWNVQSTLGQEKPCDECEGEVICEGSCECVVTDDDGVSTSYPCAPEKENPQVCRASQTIIPVPVDKVCHKCPKDCRRKCTLSSLPYRQWYHGDLLGPGVCLKDGWDVRYVTKNGCNILTIKRKSNKKFCIHDLQLRIGGKDCYKFSLLIKGKKAVTNWCLGPNGEIIIPPDSPLYSGQKAKKLVIKVCQSNCKVLSWILCVCVEPEKTVATAISVKDVVGP